MAGKNGGREKYSPFISSPVHGPAKTGVEPGYFPKCNFRPAQNKGQTVFIAVAEKGVKSQRAEQPGKAVNSVDSEGAGRGNIEGTGQGLVGGNHPQIAPADVFVAVTSNPGWNIAHKG